MDENFEDKVVVVTGASAGIGEATALQFAQRGARLALVATCEQRLRAVAARTANSSRHLIIVADLSTDQGCEDTVKKTLDHFGRVDVLVNNAGIGARTTIQSTDMATFDRVFALDVRGVYNLTRQLVPALVRAQGNVVNVSSIAATAVVVGSLPYGMAKAALDHFTRLVALELAPKGVRVNCVSPGVTESEFLKRITGISSSEYEEWLKSAERVIPLGAVCTGDDIASMIVHVASARCRRVTGAVLVVDGGMQYGDVHSLLRKQ